MPSPSQVFSSVVGARERSAFTDHTHTDRGPWVSGGFYLQKQVRVAESVQPLPYPIRGGWGGGVTGHKKDVWMQEGLCPSQWEMFFELLFFLKMLKCSL